MSRGNDVIKVLALNSAERSFTKIFKRNFEISWDFHKKGINYECTEDWI